MAILKCKMCGGDLVITPGSTIAECEYCGSMQTLPRVNDERLASFYERANDLRMSHEFDKAAEIYEKIIEENPQDSDAYWSMVLCRYGIEYVEETKGAPRKPTINRAQLVSVFEDANYRSAIKYADAAQKQIYEEEAARIDRILQRYLEISRKEPPYDVFICYKETDVDGRRTLDFVRAGEIYRKLVAEGFNVFFSHVTLESKLGEDYEPYIFAAIQSAKVMIVIGTKPEYMNAVWVKNEWSRFMTLAKEDSTKTLIPVYAGMNPYDMPEAFRFKQAQDMEQIGFMLDLVRGIEKLVGKNTSQKASQPVARTEVPASAANVDNLLQRAAIFLEDQDWSSANIYCEKALDAAPTNGKAYFYKLLAEARVTNEGALETFCNTPLEDLRAYKNAVRYADEATTTKLIELNQKIKSRLEREENERIEAERIAEELQRKRLSLSTAIGNASNLLSVQVREKEQLEARLAEINKKVTNLRGYKTKLMIHSLLVLLNTSIMLLFLCAGELAAISAVFWVPQFIFTMMLAGVRGKRKGGAFWLTLLTYGLYAFIPGLVGLIKAARVSASDFEADQNSLKSKIKQMEDKINTSRQSLSELNSKKRALESNAEES